ncbi:DUF1376 domain-containing protein [Burkholderia gladioli]|uniref:DUF1376 domain-containing protein n=1 Tax=Burkholderia gladioli TaxID=28095 RepID=UPI0016407757|nr:DUF1376 domain-containing protein [Burkholderia gladioli]
MNDLPNPLTPADCDLRDFPFMPLDVQRLCDSDLAALESPEACWAALLLWSKSWHQVPAASLPDDDRVLAKFTGYQRAPAAWQAIREGALRGWIKCSDGRLYHPVVAEKANEGWFAKHRQAHDKLCERVRKRNKTRAEAGLVPLEVPELEQWIDAGRPLERALFPEEFRTASVGKPDASVGTKKDFQRNGDGIPPENALKGKEGKGQGEVNPEGSNGGSGDASRASPSDAHLTPADVSIALIGWERERNKAARGITASNQQVIDLAALHVTPDELRRAYEAAVADRRASDDPMPINAGFIRTFVEKHRRPARITQHPPRQTPEERRRAISEANAAAFLAGIPTDDPNVIDMES